MYGLYKKMTIYGHFLYDQYIFGIRLLIHVIMKSVIKRFVCTSWNVHITLIFLVKNAYLLELL